MQSVKNFLTQFIYCIKEYFPGAKMKKLVICCLFILSVTINNAMAQNMVQEESYLKNNLTYIGLPDYPPFSYFEKHSKSVSYKSAFLKPLKDIATQYGFKLISSNYWDIPDIHKVILDVRSGEIQMFISAYSNTKLFTGLELIYPASVSNPIHVITLPEGLEKIKTAADLKKLRGVISKTEYLSDFVLRKINDLNIKYVDTPYEAYEQLFTDEADYILGGLYYNRIMASKYGIEQYLAYSKKPLFKIPVFIALSKITPMQSLYNKAFHDEFNKDKFGNDVKKEILRIVEEEISKNKGILPPAFVKKEENTAPEENMLPVTDAPGEKGGKVIEKKVEEKSIDDVLDGI